MTNFLNLRCPKCGATDSIDILATVWVRVTDEGTDADATHDGSSQDYTPESTAMCVTCGHEGTVADFETQKEGAS